MNYPCLYFFDTYPMMSKYGFGSIIIVTRSRVLELCMGIREKEFGFYTCIQKFEIGCGIFDRWNMLLDFVMNISDKWHSILRYCPNYVLLSRLSHLRISKFNLPWLDWEWRNLTVIWLEFQLYLVTYYHPLICLAGYHLSSSELVRWHIWLICIRK